jgi:hypothetical protein
VPTSIVPENGSSWKNEGAIPHCGRAKKTLENAQARINGSCEATLLPYIEGHIVNIACLTPIVFYPEFAAPFNLIFVVKPEMCNFFGYIMT